MPQHPLEAFAGFAGGNLETVVSRMLSEDLCTNETIDAVKTVYRELYLNSDKPNTKVYPGIMALLQELKAQGYQLAVNSNKGQLLLDDMIKKLFPIDMFDAVVGYSEERPSKPDPYGVDLICQRCVRERHDAIYVGDGKSDILTAANAGIPCIFVQWGQGSVQDSMNAHVTQSVEHVWQLRQSLRAARDIGRFM